MGPNATPSPPASSAGEAAARDLPLLRWTLTGFGLLAEYLLLSFLVDAGAHRDRGGVFYVLSYAGELATVAAVAGIATLVLQGPNLAARLRRAPGTLEPGRSLPWLLVLHVAAYLAFLVLTRELLGSPDSIVSALWIAPWALSGLLVVLSALAIALPPAAIVAAAPELMAAVGTGTIAGVAAWSLGQLTASLWYSSGGATVGAITWLLSLVAEVWISDSDPFVIGTAGFVVELGPECSGFEGMGLITAFLGCYTWLNRRQLILVRAIGLIPLAIAASWLSNVVRVVLLLLIGGGFSPTVAMGGFHSKAGWVFFCALAFGFVVLIERSPVFWRGARTTDPALIGVRDDSSARYLLPLMVTLATALLTGLVAAEVDLLYGARVIAGAGVLWVFRASHRALLVRPSWLAALAGVLTFFVWLLLAPRSEQAALATREHMRALGAGVAWLWIGWRLLGSIVVIPIVEELAFRGYLLRRLIGRDFARVPFSQFSGLALLGSSLVFGAMHGSWLAGSASGLIFGLVQLRGRGLTDAIAAHMITNALIALNVLALGAWDLW